MTPVLPIDDIKSKLTEEQFAIFAGIIGRQNRLRSSKPSGDGRTKYVWRMVAFYLSSNPQHQCLPVMADFDIPVETYAHYPQQYNFQKSSAYIKAELDPIIDVIVNSVPKSQWVGVHRWSRILG